MMQPADPTWAMALEASTSTQLQTRSRGNGRDRLSLVQHMQEGQQAGPWTWSHSGLVPCLVLPLTSCMALDKFCNLCFSIWRMGLAAYLGELLRGPNKLSHLKPPTTGLRSDSCSPYGSCHHFSVITKARRAWWGRHP